MKILLARTSELYVKYIRILYKSLNILHEILICILKKGRIIHSSI